MKPSACLPRASQWDFLFFRSQPLKSSTIHSQRHSLTQKKGERSLMTPSGQRCIEKDGRELQGAPSERLLVTTQRPFLTEAITKTWRKTLETASSPATPSVRFVWCILPDVPCFGTGVQIARGWGWRGPQCLGVAGADSALCCEQGPYDAEGLPPLLYRGLWVLPPTPGLPDREVRAVCQALPFGSEATPARAGADP